MYVVCTSFTTTKPIWYGWYCLFDIYCIMLCMLCLERQETLLCKDHGEGQLHTFSDKVEEIVEKLIATTFSRCVALISIADGYGIWKDYGIHQDYGYRNLLFTESGICPHLSEF